MRGGSAVAVGCGAALGLLLGGVLVGRGAHHGLEDLLVGLVPVGAPDELGAVPGVHARPCGAHVVLAAGGEGTQHAFEAQRVELGLREVEVLIAPARLLAGHDLALAKALLRGANALYAVHGGLNPTHVEHITHLFLRSGALALGVHLLEDFLDHGRVFLRAMLHHDGVVALGAHPHVLHVGLGAGPPHAVHLLARVAGGLRFLERGGVHHSPTPQNHIIRTALANTKPGGLLLHAGRGHGQQLELEAVHLRALLQQRNGLLAVRAVVVDQGDFLALELVEAALLLANVLDDGIGRHPIRACQREIPFEYPTILRFATAQTGRDDRNFVDRCLLRQREGDARGQRLKHSGAAVLAFQALVTLDTAVGGIGGLALLIYDLHAVDATTGVGEFEIVRKTVREWSPIGRIRAGAVHQ